MTPDDTEGAASEVVATIRRAARDALERGAAGLTTTTVRERYGEESPYDAASVLLTPRNPQAAEIVVEVQMGDLWWFSAAEGPGYEFYDGMDGDWHALLASLVEAVVAGRFRIERFTEWRRSLLRPWRMKLDEGWASVFDTPQGPVSTVHFFSEAPPTGERRFEPY